jgi:RNA polymerase sigma factor (sigma-70 family)
MRAASIAARTTTAGPSGSRRLLAMAGDQRLVEQIRRGNEAAFEVAFQRHGPAILGFCRHMLGSPEEAEDAVQLTFAAAHRDLLRDPDREIALKPWLFTIARNRCVSMLRAGREPPIEYAELPTSGLAEQVAQRAELRQLLCDVRELPDEQRAALLLAEIGDLSHTEVARVLDCQVARVKALVFRARSALIERREARETPCESIQEQLANLRGGSLRRTRLRLHLRECAACRAYRDQVKQQRKLLAAALPVTPGAALKSSVLAAVGIGGGSAGGGMGVGLASIAGTFTGGAGAGTIAKVAAVGVLAGGGAVAGERVLDSGQGTPSPQPAPAVKPVDPAAGPGPAQGGAAAKRARVPAARAEARPGAERRSNARGRNDERVRAQGRERSAGAAHAPGPAAPSGGRALGHGRQKAGKVKPNGGRARGPVDAPPASTPVRRGPVGPKPKPSPAPKAGPSPRAKPAPKVKAKAAPGGPPAAIRAPGPPPREGNAGDKGGRQG